ncbi:MliC family protein [Vibrio sp. ZSDE26]|uniref:MliC family protein n=1 Tax=Vibrio amylolyticus TaxID=2847292 RepID=A0A9X2BIR8_9VIBR|nr:MliC family protein [Vibrio amylolyticus]MCK6265311.1 MliC family protein [Vibrio amylolyticus]
MRLRMFFLLALGLSLMGCSQSSVNEMKIDESLYHTYRCQSDMSFDVAYIPDSEIAVLRVEEMEYALIQIRSGSGTRYILNDGTAEVTNPVTLRTKGDEARLEYNQQVYKNCKTQ